MTTPSGEQLNKKSYLPVILATCLALAGAVIGTPTNEIATLASAGIIIAGSARAYYIAKYNSSLISSEPTCPDIKPSTLLEKRSAENAVLDFEYGLAKQGNQD